MTDEQRRDEEQADGAPEAPPSEEGAHQGGGARVDQGSSTGAPGISGTNVSDFRPEHAEPTPPTPDEK